MPKLRVLAHPQVDVLDHAALEAGLRRVIGKVLVDAASNRWEPKPEPVEITGPPERFGAEYAAAIRDGDLFAADEATARVAGVPFTQTKAAGKATKDT